MPRMRVLKRYADCRQRWRYRYHVASNDGQGSAEFIDEKRDANCLAGFNQLLKESVLCDITLVVEGKKFPCHRILLAASSDYFKAMFTTQLQEAGLREVVLEGIDAQTMQLVMDYLYTGRVLIHPNSVETLLGASNMLQLLELKEGCAEFVDENMDVDNCIGIYFFSNLMKCEDLETNAWGMISEKFNKGVSDSTEFLELPLERLLSIIQFDDLNVTEADMFLAVCQWIMYKYTLRLPLAYEALSQVRFIQCESEFLYDDVMEQRVVQNSPAVQSLLAKVVKYKLLKHRWIESDLNYVPRYGQGTTRIVVYTCYLDDEKQALQIYGHRSLEVNGCRWGKILCDLPNGVQNPTFLVTADNHLYLAGGGGKDTRGFYKLDTRDMTFDEMCPLPACRRQFVLLEADSNQIYALGGCNGFGHMITVVHKYTFSTEEWSTASAMPKGVRYFSAVAYHGKFFIFGGECEKSSSEKTVRDQTEISTEVFCFDTEKDKWTQLENMPTPRALAGCTVYKDKIYVLGGFSEVTDSWIKDKSPENNLKSVDIFDPAKGTWEEGPPLPRPLCAMGAVKYEGTIYLLGGESDREIGSSVYKLEGDAWVNTEDMQTGVTETSLHSYFSVMNLAIEESNFG